MATLKDPKFWGRVLSLGFWNPDRGGQPVQTVMSSVSSGAALSDDRVMQISAAFSCIRLISELTAALPLVVYQRNADGTREPAPGHWLSKLLQEPNPLMTGQELRETWGASLTGWGNAYCHKVNSASGKVVQLWPLRPSSMKVERPDLDRLVYKYTETGPRSAQQEYTQADILHIKGFGADGITGLSPLAQARQALGLAVASEDFAGAYYRNGGKPSGVMMIDKILTDAQRASIEAKYGAMAQGGEGANKLWVLEAFAKYQQITIPPEDAQMLQTRQFQIAEIARFFRVPLFLLMDTEKATSWGSGLEQQNLAFLAYSLNPYLRRIETAVNRWVLPENERARYYVEHNVEGLLRTDSKTRAEWYQIMAQNGFMDRNEVRQKENMRPRDGADVLTAQVNLAPLDKLGAEPPAPPPPTDPAEAVAPVREDVAEVRRELARVAEKLLALSVPAPIVNVAPAAVKVETAPVQVDVTVEGGKNVTRTIKRQDDGSYQVQDA